MRKIAAALFVIVLWACTGEDAKPTNESKGGLNEPCATGDLCLGGLTCVAGRCTTNAVITPDASTDAAGDAGCTSPVKLDPIYPSAVGEKSNGNAAWQFLENAGVENDAQHVATLVVSAGTNNRSLVAGPFALPAGNPPKRFTVTVNAAADDPTVIQVVFGNVTSLERQVTAGLRDFDFTFEASNPPPPVLTAEVKVKGLSGAVLSVDFVSLTVERCP